MIFNRVQIGDCREVLRELPAETFHTCVTSPPYWGLRSYVANDSPLKTSEIGLEETPEVYVAKMVEVFREVRRVLRDDGTLWLNIGDSYVSAPSGNKPGQFASSGLTNPWRHDETRPVYRPAKNSRGETQGNPKQSFRRDREPVGGVSHRPVPGLKPKDLVGIPWLLAFALRADGWWLRADIIWHKPNPMPESIADRPTKAHEYVFLLAKSRQYHYDAEAIREPITGGAHPRGDGLNPKALADHGSVRSKQNGSFSAAISKPKRSGNKVRNISSGVDGDRPADHLGRGVPWEDDGSGRNKRSVWTVKSYPYSGSHFATFPPDLIKPCILAGAPAGGVVLDPFMGSGTVGRVAEDLGRRWFGCELNPDYERLIARRTAQTGMIFGAQS